MCSARARKRTGFTARSSFVSGPTRPGSWRRQAAAMRRVATRAGRRRCNQPLVEPFDILGRGGFTANVGDVVVRSTAATLRRVAYVRGARGLDHPRGGEPAPPRVRLFLAA